MSLRLVMMGTGKFALPTLRGLYESDHQVVGLYTQPDRTGRGHHRHVNPMKEAAMEHGTPVLQPIKANADKALAELESLDADLLVVAAYGQILSSKLLQIPKFGAINVHASLLPKYRGAAPIQHAILRGETETGVTIFRIEPKLDAGPILAVESTPIGPKETYGELEQRLADLSVGLVRDVVDRIESGSVEPIIQDAAAVTLAPRLGKESGAVDWSQTAEEIGWHIRAMQPWPNPFTFLEREEGPPLRLILISAQPSDITSDSEAGSVAFADRKQLVIQTGAGTLDITKLQPQGKRAMDTADFLCGHPVSAGTRLLRCP